MVFTKMQSRAPDRPKPARILLVDDNEAILTRAARVLTPGCAVVGAVRDGAALEAAHTLQPEVIVLAISMPGMNGFEVAT
jgi:CheY-like chemotaxis protein